MTLLHIAPEAPESELRQLFSQHLPTVHCNHFESHIVHRAADMNQLRTIQAVSYADATRSIATSPASFSSSSVPPTRLSFSKSLPIISSCSMYCCGRLSCVASLFRQTMIPGLVSKSLSKMVRRRLDNAHVFKGIYLSISSSVRLAVSGSGNGN